MKRYPPNRYWINTVELRVCWSQLRRVLRVTMLPRWGGGRVCCTPDDFMLMHIAPNGDVNFKSIITRNHLIMTPDGRLRVPTGGPWARGVFAHHSA